MIPLVEKVINNKMREEDERKSRVNCETQGTVRKLRRVKGFRRANEAQLEREDA
jgi:hypothetical protein